MRVIPGFGPGGDHAARLARTLRHVPTRTQGGRTVTLAYPGEEDIGSGRVSGFTPIGQTLIGRAEGQTADGVTLDGKRKTLTVLHVIYQPEAGRSVVFWVMVRATASDGHCPHLIDSARCWSAYRCSLRAEGQVHLPPELVFLGGQVLDRHALADRLQRALDQFTVGWISGAFIRHNLGASLKAAVALQRETHTDDGPCAPRGGRHLPAAHDKAAEGRKLVL